ncbi:MAG: bifunctional adenosylcobinamide kinase/adenosylcobinamide-phosphate guanylyltransferase [Oscillibacter sp.]|nr:bifunctional adenosylcobinamide kinase/adenosylcobinamide-phosphate guanylyltransferase [Oscillibacter sp.]
MFTLIIGGSASGKSEFAESLILASPHMPRLYIATMEPFDEECRARIARHRRMRAEKQFETVECYTSLSGLRLAGGGCVLLECLGNLAANELYSPAGAGTAESALHAILSGVDALLKQCDDLVVVSNETFTGGNRYAGETDDYLHLLADANRALARRADRVCEVVCGLPQFYKGAPV